MEKQLCIDKQICAEVLDDINAIARLTEGQLQLRKLELDIEKQQLDHERSVQQHRVAALDPVAADNDADINSLKESSTDIFSRTMQNIIARYTVKAALTNDDDEHGLTWEEHFQVYDSECDEADDNDNDCSSEDSSDCGEDCSSNVSSDCDNDHSCDPNLQASSRARPPVSQPPSISSIDSADSTESMDSQRAKRARRVHSSNLMWKPSQDLVDAQLCELRRRFDAYMSARLEAYEDDCNHKDQCQCQNYEISFRELCDVLRVSRTSSAVVGCMSEVMQTLEERKLVRHGPRGAQMLNVSGILSYIIPVLSRRHLHIMRLVD
eukprot:m.26186 g.26186  ORF g.26186 m.26186 type:complete len:322 (+) comp9886_c0_seq1:56-1021(+)